MRTSHSFSSLLVAFAFLLTLSLATIADDRAEMKVRGGGFFKDRLLVQQLKALHHEEPTFFEPVDIEDAALIIISDMQSNGYLEARTLGKITSTDNTASTVEWDKDLDVFLPAGTEATLVEFEIIPGPRFYYASLELKDNPVIKKEEAEAYFYKEPYFFGGDESKVFTPSQFTSGAQNLRAQLEIMGYREAQVFSEVKNLDTVTGAADTQLEIQEGPLFLLKDVTVESPLPGIFSGNVSTYLEKPYNTFIRQDIIRDIRNAFYSAGYADVQFEHQITATPDSSSEVSVSLTITVLPGEQYNLSSIKFEGADTVKRKLLRKQLTVEEGSLLNPAELDVSRLNLSRLGLFQKVEYQLEKAGDGQQALTFQLRDRTTWELDSLIGWGSYENLRLGIVAEKLNAFGVGHRLQIKSVISNKSLLGETRYLIPNFMDTQFPLSSKLFYLEREELSFDREEFGVTFGTSKYLQALDLNMDAVYNFESLNAKVNDLGTTLPGPEKVRSGSFEVRFGRDKRDNPLNPESGYRFFADIEWGAEALGGEVDYQAAELGLSYHKEIKRGLIWHGSISHAVVGSFNKPQSQIPNNKLLFPGGENSIRGYERGGAAPINELGEFFGAQSYMLINLELEQRLTDSFSVVAFFDGLGMANHIDDYPFDEYLSSIGLGIRFRTFMGPIRLEYGHNLDQRLEDPSGTLHLSLGFPF